MDDKTITKLVAEYEIIGTGEEPLEFQARKALSEMFYRLARGVLVEQNLDIWSLVRLSIESEQSGWNYKLVMRACGGHKE